jgi:hypothetical protein
MIDIFDCEQGSSDWFAARAGIPTASEFKSILAKGEGKMRRAYMLRLAGERLTGAPAETFENGHMIRGREMEAEARELYAFAKDVEVRQVGFIRNQTAGCSPDALIGDSGMLEVKTKLPHILIDCLLREEMPSEHRAQTQGALWVAQREWLDFVAYWPGLPVFVQRQYRDDAYIAVLAAEIERFNVDLAEIVERIRRYGEPPRERRRVQLEAVR